MRRNMNRVITREVMTYWTWHQLVAFTMLVSP